MSLLVVNLVRRANALYYKLTVYLKKELCESLPKLYVMHKAKGILKIINIWWWKPPLDYIKVLEKNVFTDKR